MVVNWTVVSIIVSNIVILVAAWIRLLSKVAKQEQIIFNVQKENCELKNDISKIRSEYVSHAEYNQAINNLQTSIEEIKQNINTKFDKLEIMIQKTNDLVYSHIMNEKK